jgi:serine/threonine-protein kinase PknG
MIPNCQRPGCKGFLEEGFCSDCGLAPIGARQVALASSSSPVSAASSPMSARTGTRTRTRGSRGSAGLGAGFVSVPPVLSLDPLARVMKDAHVPENRRFCGACHGKVSRAAGFCPHCGVAFSFEPTLAAGDLVAGQYEVKGPIAFGGLGWIYLAQDKKLEGRWVVLKGLLDSKDEAQAQAAVQERAFLSAVKHPQIVGVYNFASHGQNGFIVMEYVGGKTLSEVRKERGALPAAEAIAYMHRVLAAFAYLHDAGLVYCDFKPSNVMVDDDVKLIDMGGVRRVDDQEGEVFGTKGFFAPEIEKGEAPTFASDLYTVARTLAVLVCDFDFQGKHLHSLPQPAEEPIFARHESLHRFLVKATRPRPEERFADAREMAEQLLGVLRDVVAVESGEARAVESRFFGPAEAEGGLPALQIDGDDPAAAAIAAASAPDPALRATLLASVAKRFPDSLEARLRLGAAFLAKRAVADADTWIEAARVRSIGAPAEWRASWFRGLSLLEQAKPGDARPHLERALAEVPGELVPKLACALAAERAFDRERAARLYDVVSRSDPSLVEASFGLARCRDVAGDRDGALEALGRVPATSSAWTRARVEIARRLTDEKAGVKELVLASATIEALAAEDALAHELRAALLQRAVALVESGKAKKDPDQRVLGLPLDARALRAAAERELRLQARHTESEAARLALVDRANATRPFSLI